ncbi:hypothetical protein DOTSEDRAFT_71269 [Dothistroma septosporum NZE10]|uniref:Dihydrofolate reductase n=1 Tax=Dothistroma septosporum (strain NZE10 / CBS 128990) TaxID=675120 RepID=N1PSV8_DOTSN|nr:hypothetical protein DOTSEDRAFT_71269 [Dothistroma septosporum NZE10]
MLKKDMAYFARVTKRAPVPRNTGSLQSDTLKESILKGTSRNVVIMGRKTWESIPPKRRPLPERTNIVITSQNRSDLDDIPDDVVVASDIQSGLKTLEDMVKQGRSLPATRAFVIGGASIYKAALELPQANRILMTRISKDYECDTFFPDVLDDTASGWQPASHAEHHNFVGEDIDDGPVSQAVGEEDISMKFQLYERN